MNLLPPDLYETIDPAIAPLCRFINEDFPGIPTTSSCQGWIDGHRRGEPWRVYVSLDLDDLAAGVESLAYLAWLTNGGGTGLLVTMHVNSPPPYLNDPAPYFYIESNTVHPDEFMRAVEKVRTILAQGPQESRDD